MLRAPGPPGRCAVLADAGLLHAAGADQVMALKASPLLVEGQKTRSGAGRSLPGLIDPLSIRLNHRSVQKPDPFPQGFLWFFGKKDPWKEWGRYPSRNRGLEEVTARSVTAGYAVETSRLEQKHLPMSASQLTSQLNLWGACSFSRQCKESFTS